MAAIVAIVAYILGQGDGPPNHDFHPRGEIALPARGKEVSSPFTAEGTLSNIPPDRRVWLAVRLDDGFFLQRTAEIPSQNRHWTAKITEPRSGLGADLSFSLALLTVDRLAHRGIEESLRRGRGGAAGPVLRQISGSSQLADGLDEKSCVSVTLASAK